MGKKKEKAAPLIPLLRTSERNDFKRCPFLWDMTWVQGYSTRRTPTWSWFGTAIHKALEVRYPPGVKRGSRKKVLKAFEDALNEEVRKVYTAGGTIEDDEVVDGLELGKAMLIAYIDEFGEDQEWEVIHSEQSFQIDVMDPDDPNKVLVTYAGTWDSLWRHIKTGEYWLVDHKTRKSFLSNWDYLGLNDQGGSYLWAAPEVLKFLGIFKGDEVIEGIIFNYLRKALPDKRPLDKDGMARNNPQKEHYKVALEAAGVELPARLPVIAVLEEMAKKAGIDEVLGDVSKVQPAKSFHREEVYRSPEERVTQGQRVQNEAKVMDKYRSGELKIIKVPTEDCVRCKIFEYCLLHESDPAGAKELGKAILKKRDPYVDHREAMEKGGVVISG